MRVLLVALPALAAVGCAPPGEPKERVLLQYLESARYHGQVRRAWPEGQRYLDQVLKHAVKLWGKLDAGANALALPALWLESDARWQEPAALDAEIKHLKGLLEELYPPQDDKAAAKPEEVGPRSVDELIAAIDAALHHVPEDLALPDESATRSFVQRAWESLEQDGRPALEARAHALVDGFRARIEFVERVAANAAQFDASRPGLALTDAAKEEELRTVYAALRATAAEREDATIAHAAQRLPQLADILHGINKRSERGRYLLLRNEQEYLQDELKAIPKAWRAQLRMAQQRLKELGSGASSSRLRQEQQALVDELTRLRDEADLRIKAILDPTKTAEHTASAHDGESAGNE